MGAFDVLKHLREEEAALAGMWRALRPGGGLLLLLLGLSLPAGGSLLVVARRA